MDPALKDIVYAAIWAVVVLVMSISGSGALVFQMMRSAMQSFKVRLDDCEKKHAETDQRLRQASWNCPITKEPCPLQSMYPRIRNEPS